eukprot:1054961_1
MSFRNKMRAIDLDYNKRMALIEFLVFNYEKPIPDLLSKPQGMNETLLKAQRALEAVQNEIATLKAKEADLRKKSSGTGVRATTAKQELNAFLSADKTELNRAFLTAEAAVRAAKKLGGDVAQGFVVPGARADGGQEVQAEVEGRYRQVRLREVYNFNGEKSVQKLVEDNKINKYHV